jgi:hypothetical protein
MARTLILLQSCSSVTPLDATSRLVYRLLNYFSPSLDGSLTLRSLIHHMIIDNNVTDDGGERVGRSEDFEFRRCRSRTLQTSLLF